MRILRLIASVRPEYGGPVQGLRMTAAKMAEAGHITEVATTDDPAAPHLRDFPFPVHAMGQRVRRVSYSPELTRWVGENAAAYDAAVIHGLWNHATVAGWRALVRARVPYVVYAHGMMDPWFRGAYPLKHVAKQVYWWALQGRVLRDAAMVLFTSEEERSLAHGMFIGPSYHERVVAYGASEPPAADAAQMAAFHARAPALNGRRYLLFMSRIHPKKGCDLLVDAFAAVAGSDPGLDLVIAGPDETGLVAELKGRVTALGIAARVHWPGMLDGQAKWGAMRGAEAFVLPSHQENFGVVVAEAMACGVPVLISDKVNIWREVEAAGAGLVDSDTPEGTVRLLRRFLALAPATRKAMAAAAREGYEQQFSADGAARDLTQVLEDAIGDVTGTGGSHEDFRDRRGRLHRFPRG